ncbi:MAG TPA: hypothetical protein PKI94_00600 [Candidatus Gastranaerophilaceae bacterium]|nr:hypothetical protein [Candidatus Gastranaerophilaceae bacterium]
MQVSAIKSFQKNNILYSNKTNSLKNNHQGSVSFTQQKYIESRDFLKQDWVESQDLYTRYKDSSINLEKELKRLDYYIQDAENQRDMADQNFYNEMNPKKNYEINTNKFIEYWDNPYYPKTIEIRTPSGEQKYEYYMTGKIKKIQIEDFKTQEKAVFYFEHNNKAPFYEEVSYYDKISKENVKIIKTKIKPSQSLIYVYTAEVQGCREKEDKHLSWFENTSNKKEICILNENNHSAFIYDQFGLPQYKQLF